MLHITQIPFHITSEAFWNFCKLVWGQTDQPGHFSRKTDLELKVFGQQLKHNIEELQINSSHFLHVSHHWNTFNLNGKDGALQYFVISPSFIQNT